MVRGILKEIEGVISLVIFILFLIFYLTTIKNTIFTNSKEDFYMKLKQIDEIYNNLKKEGYIINFRVYIPKYSKELLCSAEQDYIKRDFCERHPIFIPTNLSFLFDYDGVLNNTNDTIFKRNLGAFLYLNISEFKCEENDDYILINASRTSTSVSGIFITTPTLYYWLRNGKNVSILINEYQNFNYCYLKSNGECSDIPGEDSYGIIIKLEQNENLRFTINISKSNINNAKRINITGLKYMSYEIIYEPKCYLDLEFLVLKNLSFNFDKYTDLKCTNYYMNNSKLSYNPNSKILFNIYYNVSFNGEPKNTDNIKIENLGPACIQYYDYSNQNLLGVYRVLFSNTSWFFEIGEYNFSDQNFGIFFKILDYSSEEHGDPRGGFNYRKYFNFTEFVKISDIINSDRILLAKETMFTKCNYALLFFDNVYRVNISIIGATSVIIPSIQVSSYLLRPTIYYYCIDDESISNLVHLYYSYSMPKYELLNINRISYIDLQDLKEKEYLAFYLINSNILFGNKESKKFSKSYYTYIKQNNSLIKDYLIIYIE